MFFSLKYKINYAAANWIQDFCDGKSLSIQNRSSTRLITQDSATGHGYLYLLVCKLYEKDTEAISCKS